MNINRTSTQPQIHDNDIQYIQYIYMQYIFMGLSYLCNNIYIYVYT